jgi:hypothetical protein
VTGASLQRRPDPIQLSNRNFKRVSTLNPVPEVCTAATGAFIIYIMYMYLRQTRFLWTTGQSFPSSQPPSTFCRTRCHTIRYAHTSDTPRGDFLYEMLMHLYLYNIRQ